MISRVLAQLNHDEFFGREAELNQIVRPSPTGREKQRSVILAAPDAGASELLRQAYDRLFARRGEIVPVHFALKRSDASLLETARRLFQTVLQQYVAYRRVDPALSRATLTFYDLQELALPGDYEAINHLIEGYTREQSAESGFVDFCFSLPNRLAGSGRILYLLIDATEAGPFREDLKSLHRLLNEIVRGRLPFVIAGLRRQINELMHSETEWEAETVLHLEQLTESSANALIESLARRYQIELNEPTRDLIVQELSCSPRFISDFMRAARGRNTALTSFLACQRLYVDELLGGRFQQHFNRIVQMIAPGGQTSKNLLRILYESAMTETHKSSLWAWKKRLGVAAPEFEHVIDALHVYELLNSSAAFVEVNSGAGVWLDYLRAHYRVEVGGEARARVVATTLLETLKRAPQTMSQKYRREAAIGLRQMLVQFNCQNVPAVLLNYEQFAQKYKGEDPLAIDEGLDAETDLVQLPQVVQAAACSSYPATINCDRERCIVAHAFAAAEYTDENEIVWLAAEIDSKMEASRELTEQWCDRIAAFARESDFSRFRIWLIAPEGFSPEAVALLREREAFGSSRHQAQLLSARIAPAAQAEKANADEYEMVIPMGADTELIAAHTVEKIARRVNFRPEAVNQIKTALVEACINATEHSLSPDRKIYQRFVVEDDKLVVTVASRGVLPASFAGPNGQIERVENANGKGRRGWGLKLIRTLMDEVEFEHVDDGTQLKMTKYIR